MINITKITTNCLCDLMTIMITYLIYLNSTCYIQSKHLQSIL